MDHNKDLKFDRVECLAITGDNSDLCDEVFQYFEMEPITFITLADFEKQ